MAFQVPLQLKIEKPLEKSGGFLFDQRSFNE